MNNNLCLITKRCKLTGIIFPCLVFPGTQPLIKFVKNVNFISCLDVFLRKKIRKFWVTGDLTDQSLSMFYAAKKLKQNLC